MNKSGKICLLLLIGVICACVGECYVLYGPLWLMLGHYVLVAFLGYYLPRLFFEQGDYRMVSYEVSILISFAVFMLLYLNVSSEADFPGARSWREVLLFDATAFMLASFIGAMSCTKYIK